MEMFQNKLYEIGQNLGLKKIDIDSLLYTIPTNEDSIKSASPVGVYKDFGKYGTVSINDFSKKMVFDRILDKLYELGRCLGLDKKDIENIYFSQVNKKDNIRVTSPLEVYKDSSHYGTISIKDF